MATNSSEHLGLHLWEPTDQVLRTEFNENWQKLDAAAAGLREDLTQGLEEVTDCLGHIHRHWDPWPGSPDQSHIRLFSGSGHSGLCRARQQHGVAHHYAAGGGNLQGRQCNLSLCPYLDRQWGHLVELRFGRISKQCRSDLLLRGGRRSVVRKPPPGQMARGRNIYIMFLPATNYQLKVTVSLVVRPAGAVTSKVMVPPSVRTLLTTQVPEVLPVAVTV